MARPEGWLDEVLLENRERGRQRVSDDPNEQYLRCRVLRATPEQDTLDRTTVWFDARVLKKATEMMRVAHTANLRVEMVHGSPAWQRIMGGPEWVLGLMLIYGSGPPSLDGQWMYRHLACLTENLSVEIRTDHILNRDGEPHPDRSRW